MACDAHHWPGEADYLLEVLRLLELYMLLYKSVIQPAAQKGIQKGPPGVNQAGFGYSPGLMLIKGKVQSGRISGYITSGGQDMPEGMSQ
jgi:hypothetical protein